MKLNGLVLVLFIAISAMLMGCIKDLEDPIPQDVESFRDIRAQGFDFQTTRQVSIHVELPDNYSLNGKSSMVFYSGNPGSGGEQLFDMGSDTREFEKLCRLPSTLDTLYMYHSHLGWHEAPISNGMVISSYPYLVEFGEDAFNASINSWGKRGVPQPTAGIIPQHKASSSNSIINGGFDNSSNFGSGSSANSAMTSGIWYKVSGSGGSTATFFGETVYQFTQTSGFDGLVQRVNTSGGVNVTSSVDYNGESGTQLVLYIYALQGNSVLSFTNTSVNIGGSAQNTWGTLTTSLLVPSGADNVRIMAYAKANGNKKLRIDNAVLSGVQVDSDGDGVADDFDDFPNDASMAYTSYYPSANSFGTHVFEDLWPNMGDFDFNDLSVAYQYQVYSSSSNQVVKIRGRYVVKAIGAGFENGFGVSFPFAKSTVSSAVGYEASGNTISRGSNGLENHSGSNAIVIVYDNVSDFAGVSMMNVYSNTTLVELDTTDLVITFNSPQTSIGQAPFNPFLFVNGDRSREIHFKGEQPTANASSQYFGTAHDVTSLSSGNTYQTANGLPWALDFPIEFKYMQEKQDILNGYLKLASWAQSNGSSYNDWYTNTSLSYRNSSYLFQ